MSNTFYMMEDIEEATARDFAEFLATVEEKSDVVIQMLSHGGLVFAGLGICQMIKQAQSREIVFSVNVYGIAASAASDIILSCDHIYMAPGSQILVHSAFGGTDEGIDRANGEQLALIRKRIPNYSEKDLEQDHWFSADEAVKIGLADNYIDNSSESRAVYKLSAYLHPYMEDKKMADIKTKAAEEIIERKFDEKEDEKKEIVPEAECGDKEDPRAEDNMDIMEAVVRRLEEIEHRLAVLEGEGKKEDDEMAPSASARRKALLAKLNAVCAPVPSPAQRPVAVVETPAEENQRFKATYKNFDSILADFIKRK